MDLYFKCKKCSARNLVLIEKALPIWKEKYQGFSTEEKKNIHFNLFIESACPICGESKVFEGKIFRYMFEVIFNILVLKGKSKINV